MKRCSKKGHTNHIIVKSVQETLKDKTCSTEGCTAKAALRKECARSMVCRTDEDEEVAQTLVNR